MQTIFVSRQHVFNCLALCLDAADHVGVMVSPGFHPDVISDLRVYWLVLKVQDQGQNFEMFCSTFVHYFPCRECGGLFLELLDLMPTA